MGCGGRGRATPLLQRAVRGAVPDSCRSPATNGGACVSESAQAEATLAVSRFEQRAAFGYGRYVPIDEARVSLLDTGFSRSDVTYDVVAVWGGAFFRLQDHLQRFERSCGELRMELKHDRDEIVS